MNLLGKMADASFWAEVRNDDFYDKYRNGILKIWNDLAEGREVPPLPYSKYKLYWTTGNRNIYEAPYFKRRHIMNSAAILSLIYPEEEKYIEKLEDVVFDICNEYTWCLPAHIDHCKGAAPNVIDLFAAETGFMLAEIYTLHGSRLDPLVRERIFEEVKKRIITATIELDGKWKWETMENNWASVCAGSVGCTAMLLFPNKFDVIKPRIDASIENYLSGFLGEGVCLEGNNYWDYGFGYFTIYADMLERYTNGSESYFEREDVKAAATFPQSIYISPTSLISFSDAYEAPCNNVGILHYLKTRYPSEVRLPSIDLCDIAIRPDRLSYMLRGFAWSNKDYANLNEIKNDCGVKFSPKSQWYVNKTSQFGFAAKGGHNKEPHNHLDIGHFIYHKNGAQVFVDLGSGLYDAIYFSDRRYEVLEPSYLSHSVPTIDGEGQRFGITYAARSASAGDAFFELDIAGAYSSDKLTSLVRRFDIADNSVTLTDTYTLASDAELVERFVTRLEPRVVSDGVIEVAETTLSYDSNSVASCSFEKLTSPKNECYAINLTLKPGVRRFTCTIS